MLTSGFRLIKPPLTRLGYFLVNTLFVPFYNIYYKIKGKKTPNTHLRVKKISLFSVAKSHVPHIVFITLIGLTTAYNVKSHAFYAEDFGTKTPVYEITQGKDAVLVESALTPQELQSLISPKSQNPFPYPQFTVEQGIDTDRVIISDTLDLFADLPFSSTEGSIRDEVVEYQVEDGDTLSRIAAQFSISLNTVLWENNLHARSILRPGTTLMILPVSGVRYTVQKGDTVGRIAQRYEVSESSILEANRLSESSVITAKQILILPDARPRIVRRTSPTATSAPAERPAPKVTSQSGFIWPSPGKKINQYFSWRHSGLDVDNIGINDPIYASEQGVVERSGWGSGYGNLVVIKHPDGSKTLYAHLKTIYSKRGDTVSKGDVLGIMGTTGRSTGVHLHFEIIINGKRVNPLSYL